VASLSEGNTIAAHQVQQLFGQACAQRQRVEVFHQTVQLANAARMQAQKCLVQLHMKREYFFEIGFGHAQHVVSPWA
jgi:hypothetical protein